MWNLLAQFAPLLIGGLLAGRRSGQQANPAQLYAQLFQQQLGQLGQAMLPAQVGLANMAERRGQALGQELAGSMGAIGALSSGAGRAAYSLGQTAGGQLRMDAEAELRQALVDMSRQNALGLLAPQQQYVESQRAGSENFMAWLSQIMAGGQLGSMLGGLGGVGGGGGRPGGGMQLQPMLQNPNLLPFTPPPNPLFKPSGSIWRR